jgi:hypothetical protein
MAGIRPAPVVRDAPKLFRERMARENRTEDFDKLVASYVAGGRALRYATYDAMRDMGYKSLDEEVKLYKRAQCVVMHDRRRAKQAECVKRYKLRVKAKKAAAASASVDAQSAVPDA